MMLAQYQVRSRTSAQPAASWRRSGPPGTGTYRTWITARVPALTPKVAASSTNAQPAPTVKINAPAMAGPATLAALPAALRSELAALLPAGSTRARDQGQRGGNAECGGSASDRGRHSDRRDGEMTCEQEQADRELREPGDHIGCERGQSGPHPVDDDSGEWQQRDPRQHAAHQDDGQPGGGMGRGHDREGERRRSDGIAERVDHPSGEQDAEVPFPQGRSHAPTLAAHGKTSERFSEASPCLARTVNGHQRLEEP